MARVYTRAIRYRAPVRRAFVHLAPALRALIVLAILSLALFIALRSGEPPAVTRALSGDADLPPTEFSSARAKAHLAIVARSPHRIGSPAHESVRRYIVDELEKLGLAPEVQETTVVQERYVHFGFPARVATVKNVVARKKGRERGAAVIVMAHYDTRSMTPGAGDDGFGVATLLETARALSAGPMLRRDVVFVMTDGEEPGLLGAKAFVEGHPAAKDAGIVLNFDARGDRGPVLMYQTSEGGAHLVSALASVAPHPMANGLSQAAIRYMPNDSDLSEWIGRGGPHVDGMAFANIEGSEQYHAPTDDLAHMDERTLAHHGAYALPLTRYFAGQALPLAKDGDASYFAAGPLFVHYGAWLEWPLAILADLLLAFVATIAIRRRRARGVGLLLGFVVAAGGAMATALVINAAWSVASHLHPEYALLAAESASMKRAWIAGLVLLAVALPLALQAALGKRVKPLEIGLGGALILAALATFAAKYAPGGGGVFVWALIGALVPWLLVVPRGSAASLALRVASAVPALVLLPPVIAFTFAAFGPDAALVLAPLVATVVAVLAPAIAILLAPDRRVLPSIALVLAFACFAVAHVTPAFDRTTPRPTTLLHAVDVDLERAFWVSPEPPDAWTSKVLAGAKRDTLPAYFASHTSSLFAASAPYDATIAAPRVSITRDLRAESRALELRVDPSTSDEILVVSIESGVAWARVDGHAITVSKGALDFAYWAPPSRGVALAVGSEGPIRVRVVAQRPGFPRSATALLGARPEGTMPKSGMLPPWDEMLESDMTIVTRTFDF
jgi:hypothetical protein